MKHIEKQHGERLFEDVKEILKDRRLTDKERIPRYRTILEDLYNELTKDSSVHLGNLFARIVYIYNEYKIPGKINFKSNGVRILANDVVHKSKFHPTEFDGQKCLYQLSVVIGHFAQIDIPPNIQSVYAAHIPAFEKLETDFKNRPPLPTNNFYAVVESYYTPDDPNLNYCILICQTDELGKIEVRLSNKKDEHGFGSDLTYISDIISPYQNIYLTAVSKRPNKEASFFTTKESFIVLEPDYLIGATDLAGCRHEKGDNHLLYILNKLQKNDISERAIIGNIVGKMLDDIATKSDYNYTASFESIMRSSALGMLCLANRNGKYDNSTIQEIYHEAKTHENTLKESIEKYKGKQLIVEPTFISSKFGINGRLDLMIEGHSNQKDIIELKSSKGVPPLKKGFWINHEAQAMCYDLLVSSTFSDRIGHSSILYSAAEMIQSPERNVNGALYLTKQKILQLRNEVVSTEFKLAKGIFDVIDKMESEDFSNYPDYVRTLQEGFANTIKRLDPLLKSYFLNYMKFIYRELQVAKVGTVEEYNSSNGFADLWKLSKDAKVKNYNILVNLEILEVTEEFDITMEVKTNLFTPEVTTFRKGDIAILYPTPNPDYLDPLASQILKCVITSIEGNIVKIKLRHLQLDKDYFKSKSEHWALEKDFTEQGYYKMLELNYQFLSSDKNLIDLVLGKQKPAFRTLNPINSSEELNIVQREMVSRALSAEDYFLIQGPPGTGKTSKVLSHIVKENSDNGQNVMVIAFTNKAVDEIAKNLQKLNIDCIQLGKGEKKYHWSQLSMSLNLKQLYQKVSQTKVFVATQASFSNNLKLLKLKQFDMLVVDEASQLLEPQLTGLLKYFNRWILIGDENQLPAVVIQSEDDSACFEEELNDIGLDNLRESLFSRLKSNAERRNWTDCYGMLTIHYRMHEDIAKFPNQFYGGRLQSGDNNQKLPIGESVFTAISGSEIDKVFTKSRTVFIPTTRGVRSKINDEEAKLVKDLIEYIHQALGSSFDQKTTVGIITPFRAQIATIRKGLGKAYKDVTIDTVERFQGSERDIIIISYAVKNAAQLKSIQSKNKAGIDRKLNVAITRAKNHLIILGTRDILEKSKIFKELISSIRSNGGYMIDPNKTKSVPTNLF